MAAPAQSPEQDVLALSRSIGSALSSLPSMPGDLKRHPEPMPWSALSDLLDPASGEEGAVLGAFAILRAMNAVRVDKGGVCPTSRYALFFMRSLGIFIERSCVPVIPAEEMQEDFRSFTQVYERGRLDTPAIDHAPLHQRRIVNLIIKKRMIRDFRYQDVYLHVFHPKWEAYHLVGLSQHSPLEDDKVLIEKTMDRRFGLKPHDFEISTTFKPAELQLTEISCTTGALTEYTYQLYFVQSISPELAFHDLMKAGKGPFRWFTLEEIERKKSDQGDEIMFSTPAIMRHIKETGSSVANRLPLTRARAKDIRAPVNLQAELGKRLTLRRLFLLVILPVALVIALQLVLLLWPQINTTAPVFANLASIATILGLVPALITALAAAMKSDER